MKILSVLFISTIFSITSFAQSAPRPRITGIDHVSFYTTNARWREETLCRYVLGLAPAAPIESGETTRYMSGKQWVGYQPGARSQSSPTAWITWLSPPTISPPCAVI